MPPIPALVWAVLITTTMLATISLLVGLTLLVYHLATKHRDDIGDD